MRGEEAGSHSHSHLVYFQRSVFPSGFPSLDLSAHGSERGQAAPSPYRHWLHHFLQLPPPLFLHPKTTAALGMSAGLFTWCTAMSHALGLCLPGWEANTPLGSSTHPRMPHKDLGACRLLLQPCACPHHFPPLSTC